MFPDGGISAVCKRAWASITKTCYIEFIPTKILCLHPSSTPPRHHQAKTEYCVFWGIVNRNKEKENRWILFCMIYSSPKGWGKTTTASSLPMEHMDIENAKRKCTKKAKKRRMILVLGFVAAVAMVNDLPDDIVRLHPRLDPIASSVLRFSVPLNLRQ